MPTIFCEATKQMGNPSKFLFDTDFNEPEVPEIEEPVEPQIPMLPVAEHEQLLSSAREAAFEEGRAAALQDLLQTQEKKLTEEIEHLISETEKVLDTLSLQSEQQEQEATSFAFLVARRLCAHLIARQPMTEIMALISECLGPLRRAPHLVIRVHVKYVETLKKRMEPLIREKGFEGRLVILGEDNIGIGDCHIEWADGGILRNRRDIEKQIDGSIKNYLAARSAKAAAKATSPSTDGQAKDEKA